MADMRKETARSVRRIRKHFPEYLKLLENMMQMSSCLSFSKKMLLETDDARLFDATRGLEPFLIRSLQKNRKAIVQAVLKQQLECSREDIVRANESLRQQSVIYSEVTVRFAHNLGKLDELEVLPPVRRISTSSIVSNSAAPIAPQRRRSSRVLLLADE